MFGFKPGFQMAAKVMELEYPPKGEDLLARKIISNPICSCFKKGVEDSAHALLWCPEAKKKDDIEAWCMVMWSSWLNRNNFVHNNKVRAPDELLNFKEFQNSRAISTQVASSRSVIDSLCWSPPNLCSLKLNTDVAMKADFSHIGIGAVIRNDEGEVVSTRSKPMVGSFSTELGEYLALRVGLLLTKVWVSLLVGLKLMR
ncbi:hypothetical protein Dsin_004429 [Dipteronia sinensis]|uniref:RNase H type-1 domain-containing protein n=1 Tax=Dipteronia sinensis TaxID=43782 RepID=A0AAE0BAU2_9ROSI|nr:hypothetical protein Dsin_004429 [Dipteronia sinensis]